MMCSRDRQSPCPALASAVLLGHLDAEPRGDASGELVGHVGEHGDDALAHRLHRYFGQLEAERAEDVPPFDLALALEEEPRLSKVVGELLGLPARMRTARRLQTVPQALYEVSELSLRRPRRSIHPVL
jgi:hypothetical protein